MPQIDLLLHAEWIVTVDADNRVLTDHCIAIDSGKIVAILPSSESDTKYQASDTRYFPNQLLMPGLINSHTHAAMNLLRGIADDLPLMEWLQEHIWPVEQKWLSAEFVRAGSQLAIAEMLRSGTTCFNDMYLFPDETARVAVEMGIRASIGLIVIDFPTVWANDANEYISKGLHVHDQLHSEDLITTCFAPHAPYTVADEALSKLQILAEELDIPLHIHIHETAREIRDTESKRQPRPLERLNSLGYLSPRLMAVHMTQLIDEEIQTLATNGSHVIHCPESNMKLASGVCPVQKLLDAGVNIALGTDGAASNNDLDMFGEMRSAALLSKVHTGDASSLNATTALRMATINGAKALGIDATTGSLEVGKAADIIALQLDTLETRPMYEVISQIIYACGRQHVTDVWVAGLQRLQAGELVGVDEVSLLKTAKDWQNRIQDAL